MSSEHEKLIKSERKIQFERRREEFLKSQKMYKCEFGGSKISQGLTFDDVLLVPQYSEINSRTECVVKSWFSENIPLNLPFVSSPMDTVTEAAMAVEMARQGGLGIIHRFMTVENQVKQVEQVKRSGAFINSSPVCIPRHCSFLVIRQLMHDVKISSFLVEEGDEGSSHSPKKSAFVKNKRLIGILTHRDILCFKDDSQTAAQHMTPIDRMIVYKVPSNFDTKHCNLNQIMNECKTLLIEKKIEKVPLIHDDTTIVGLVSLKDIRQYEAQGQANKDYNGKLLLGAAIGAREEDIERAHELVTAGCDVLVLDIANGHSRMAMRATEELKERFPCTDVVAGSIATGEGAENLIRSGANGVRCGIGNGSICITRVVSGSGVPQLSAIIDTAPVCAHYDIPLCSDGGNRNSGNMCKALAMGASSVMFGKLVAGCDESPGVKFHKDGKVVKMFRGMAGRTYSLTQLEPTSTKQPKSEGKSTHRHSLQKVQKGTFPSLAHCGKSLASLHQASKAA